jgi:hypothetical protein
MVLSFPSMLNAIETMTTYTYGTCESLNNTSKNGP